jgi:hypothetical protein
MMIAQRFRRHCASNYERLTIMNATVARWRSPIAGLVILAGLVGCGRVAAIDADPAIDSAADARPVLAIAIDEDQDGITNESDNCPFLANPDQLNADSSSGDTVGDVCDPLTDSTALPHRIALFEPMNQVDRATSVVKAEPAILRGDSELFCDGDIYSNVKVNVPFERSEIWIGAEIVGNRTLAGQVPQLSLSLDDQKTTPSPAYAYFELLGRRLKLQRASQTPGTLDDGGGVELILPTGPFDMRLRMDRVSATQHKFFGRMDFASKSFERCSSGCPNSQPAQAMNVNSVARNGFLFTCFLFQTKYRYVAVVTQDAQ